MTRPIPAVPPGQPHRADLAALVFRALYQDLDLHIVGAVYVAVPKGTCCFAGPSLTEIASQISAAPPRWPDGDRGGQSRSRQGGNS